MEFGDYLKLALGRPWGWGTHDCCTFKADWVIIRGNPDPMAFIRGRYDSERSALRRISAGGGLLALWQRGMCEAGVPEADDARAGDVGVIARATECGIDEAAAIWSGERWVSLSLRGFTSGPADVLAMWRP